MTVAATDETPNAPTVPHYLDGTWFFPKEGRSNLISNPATGLPTAWVPVAEADDVDSAVRAAEGALASWSATSPLRRARVLFRFKELVEANARKIAEVISREHGKTLPDALGEVQRGLEVVEFACGIPHLIKGEFSPNVGTGVDSFSMRAPLGICVGITPFNFPAMVPMWMFPVALACGNTFILKPSERDPSTSVLLAELLTEAGAPNGVFNVLHGDKETVKALVEHRRVAAISFVGSTPIARWIYSTAAAHGKRVQALGGAKNHAVVMPDANLSATVDALIGAGYGSAGERCMSISAIVAVGKIADPLVALIAERAATLTVAAGDVAGAEMGPLVTDEHRQRVANYVKAGCDDGAIAVLDGRAHPCTSSPGYFLGPTLFDHVTTSMSIYREEIFGPVMSTVRVPDLMAAIELVNAHEFGNGAAIFTSSGAAAREFVQRVQAGMVGVNVPVPVPMAFHSFGGWKHSLFGDHAVHGEEGIRFYTRLKTVSSRWFVDADESRPQFQMPTHG